MCYAFMLKCSLPGVFLQMIMYDAPGLIEKQMHKLDSMMMKNVRNAAIDADCFLVVVDACKALQKVSCSTWVIRLQKWFFF